MILALLWVVSLIIIPKIPTAYPAVDSKIMALRVMICAFLAVAALNRKRLVKPKWCFTDTVYALMAGVFIISAAVSATAAYSFYQSWHILGLIFVSWTLSRLTLSFAELRATAWIIATLGLLASLYGISTYTGFDVLKSLYPFDFDETQAGGRAYIHSFFGNPEHYAGYAGPAAVIILGLAFQSRMKPVARAFWMICCIFTLLVVGLSGTRAAFLGFMVSAAIVFFAQIRFLAPAWRKAAWMSLIGGGVFVSLVVVVLSTPNPLNVRDMRLMNRFADIGNTQSASVRERVIFYITTVASIPNNPVFGHGPGTFRLHFFHNVKAVVDNDDRAGSTMMVQELDRRLAEHAHNDYFEIWFEQGTAGFAMFLLLICHAGVSFAVLLRRAKPMISENHFSANHIGLTITFFAAMTALFINAMASFPFHMPARSTLAWVIIGAYFSVVRQATGINATAPVSKPVHNQTRAIAEA